VDRQRMREKRIIKIIRQRFNPSSQIFGRKWREERPFWRTASEIEEINRMLAELYAKVINKRHRYGRDATISRLHRIASMLTHNIIQPTHEEIYNSRV